MSLELIEGAIDVIQAYLATEIAAEVATLNSAYADEINLPDVSNVYTAEQVEAEAQNFPYLEVLGIRTDVQSESSASMLSTHNIAIYVVDAYDQGRDILRRRVMRYCRAVIELLKAARTNPTFSGYSVVIKGGAIDYLPLRWKRGSSRVIGSAIIGVQVVTNEVYP